ncbi:MAG: hypothetical protein EOM91_05605 [Sphingobacteriia bacterium]|nr:hypothetical protein [Sphingobacteriia bacterium]NCC38608.1 hypothetical protein [Gammaproteobacteria bacterium]
MAEQIHWLYRKENRPKLWAIQITILALTLLPGLFIQVHHHFPAERFSLDTSPGFFAWFGFISCAWMVALAKFLGRFIKRDDTYYDA